MAESAITYDVFLSYNSSDREPVRRLVEKLKARGLSVFLDAWELQPGISAQQGLSQALQNSKSVAVVVGPNGVGPWQNVEIEVAIGEEVRTRWHVIPVLLPGVSVDQVPLLLRRANRIDFGEGTETEALDRLQWGITGTKPPEGPPPPPKTTQRPPGLTVAERAANTLKGIMLRATNVTFFLGGNTPFGDPGLPPSSFEIARQLLREASLMTDEAASQALFPIDLAASYYAIQFNPVDLEGRIAEIAGRSKQIPPVHRALAELLSTLRNYRKPRGGSPSRQLIVTTNPDVMMERALLQRGISFTRIVQGVNSQLLQVSEYSDVSVNDGWISLPGFDAIRCDDT